MPRPANQFIEAAGKVLAKAALLDPRMSVDEGAILAWAELLEPSGLTLDDLMPALTLHYSTSTERIMPAVLLRLARERRNDRINRTRSNDTAPHQQISAPSTVKGRKEAIQRAVAQIGRRHDIDAPRPLPAKPRPLPAKPRPGRIDSPATIAQKVARARAGGPQEIPPDDAELATRQGIEGPTR